MQEEDQINSQELTDEQMDSLIEGTDRPSNQEIPMSEKDVAATTQEKVDNYLEFTHNGKPIKAPVDQVIKWAQQGYDYPQKMAEINKQKMLFEQQQRQLQEQQKEFESKFSPYKQIDEWAQKNPTEWQRLNALYQQHQSGVQAGAIPDNVLPIINQYKQELDEVKKFVASTMEEKEMLARQAEDQKLESDIKSIREQYPDLDFDNPNEEGKSLTYQVIEHAQKHGITNFKTAFNDFYLPNLIKRAETLAKQEVSKGIQKNSKLGVLGKSPTSFKQNYSEPKNISKQSYEDLAKEALQELGLG